MIKILQDLITQYEDIHIEIQTIDISYLLDEFSNLYHSNSISLTEQLEYLGFINTLFRLKHKYILDFNKEKRTFSRDTQLFHLRKIQRMAKEKIKKPPKPYIRPKVEPSEQVLEFRSLIKALNKKIKKDINDRTQRLLEELLKERWTVQDKTALLKNLVNSKEATFGDLLETEEIEEVITSFLALLDMKRKNEVKVIQKQNFGEIIIQKETTI